MMILRHLTLRILGNRPQKRTLGIMKPMVIVTKVIAKIEINFQTFKQIDLKNKINTDTTDMNLVQSILDIVQKSIIVNILEII